MLRTRAADAGGPSFAAAQIESSWDASAIWGVRRLDVEMCFGPIAGDAQGSPPSGRSHSTAGQENGPLLEPNRELIDRLTIEADRRQGQCIADDLPKDEMRSASERLALRQHGPRRIQSG